MTHVKQSAARRSVLAAALGVVLATIAAGPAAAVADGTPFAAPDLGTYPNGDDSYPRIIRVVHDGSAANDTLLATFAKRLQGAPTTLPIYRSQDGGDSWTQISSIASHVTGWDLEAPVLYEVPYTAGGLTAGDILAAGTGWEVGDYTAQAVEVFRSTDGGASWSYLSSCTSTSGLPDTIGHGIWEPWFLQRPDGTLACFISDERPAGSATNNQVIGHYTSTDGGATWSSSLTQDVAFPADNLARPGMSTIVALPNGSYMMAYELCRDATDPDHACVVYVKTSADGLSWGTLGTSGTLVQTADDRQLLHTPYLAWSPFGGPNGTLMLTGQRVVTGSTGSFAVESDSGRVLLTNTELGVGDWSQLTAPLTIDPTGGYASGVPSCPGYSTPMAPSLEDETFVYLAATWLGTGNQCEVRLAEGRLGQSGLSPDFTSATKSGFAEYGGTWVSGGGVLRQTASGPGTKALLGSTAWTDYVVESDVRLDGAGQAGLVVRVTDPGIGADSHRGYYVGLESSSGELILGRQDYGWTSIATTAVSGGVATATWYHLRVHVAGCAFSVEVSSVGGSSLATISRTVAGCDPSGMVGLRSHYTAASWRDVEVTSADYTTYGGTWTYGDGTVAVTDSVAGAKALFGPTAVGDYAVGADVRLDAAGQAGLLTRVTNPSTGADAHTGYYAGVESASGNLVLGFQDNGWTQLGSVAVTGGVSVGTWYRMSLRAEGCTFTVTVQPRDGSSGPTTLSRTVAGCVTTGAPGLRAHSTPASWTDVSLRAVV